MSFVLVLCYPKFVSAQRFLVFNNQKNISGYIKSGDSSYFAGNYKESILQYEKITTVLYQEAIYLNQLQNQLGADDVPAAFNTLKLMTDSGFYRFWILDRDSIYKKLRASKDFITVHKTLTANFSHYLKINNIQNAVLTEKIMQMYYEDQYYQWVASFKTRYSKAYSKWSYAQVDTLQNITFRNNVFQLKQIFGKHGYLWASDIGKEATHYIWLLIQHADNDLPFQESYLKALKIAVERNEAAGADLAYLTDRVKKNKKEKQVYGTQMEYKTTVDPVKGKTVKMQPWPVEDPEKLDERRKEVGLMPMDKYLEMVKKLNNNNH